MLYSASTHSLGAIQTVHSQESARKRVSMSYLTVKSIRPVWDSLEKNPSSATALQKHAKPSYVQCTQQPRGLGGKWTMWDTGSSVKRDKEMKISPLHSTAYSNIWSEEITRPMYGREHWSLHRAFHQQLDMAGKFRMVPCSLCSWPKIQHHGVFRSWLSVTARSLYVAELTAHAEPTTCHAQKHVHVLSKKLVKIQEQSLNPVVKKTLTKSYNRWHLHASMANVIPCCQTQILQTALTNVLPCNHAQLLWFALTNVLLCCHAQLPVSTMITIIIHYDEWVASVLPETTIILGFHECTSVLLNTTIMLGSDVCASVLLYTSERRTLKLTVAVFFMRASVCIWISAEQYFLKRLISKMYTYQ